MKILSDFIIKPVVSERSYAEANNNNKYTFIVTKKATKVNIKNAIEKLFSVKVIGVATSNVKGTKTRNTRFGKKILDASYKKARIKLEKGQKINIFEEKTK